MDKQKAAEMIECQRRRWRSQDSDSAIARRAERAYFALAMLFVCIGTSLTLVQRTPFGRVVSLVGCLFGALGFYFHGRRFGQIRKLLASSDATSDIH
jgi:hypothetical protein